MLGSSDIIAFVSTTDLARARRFYADALGLRTVDENPYACVLDANATMLRVTLADRVVAAPYTVLGWQVGDIGRVVRDLRERGVDPVRYDSMDQDVEGIWTTPGGDRVAWFRDPDGNTLSVTQFH